jgi:Uma2 family endonuclease
VEVLSPSSRRTDPGTKKLAYQDAGVPDYWIVDPAEPGITAFRLEGGSYVEEAHVAGDEVFTTDRPFGMSVVPTRLLDDLRP